MIRKKVAGKWGVLSGHILAGESPIEAAIRESREEIGVDIVPYAFLGTFFAPREDGASVCFGIRALVHPDSNFITEDAEEVDRIEWKDRDFVEYLISSDELYRPEYQVHNLMAWLNGRKYPLWILQVVKVPWVK